MKSKLSELPRLRLWGFYALKSSQWNAIRIFSIDLTKAGTSTPKESENLCWREMWGFLIYSTCRNIWASSLLGPLPFFQPSVWGRSLAQGRGRNFPWLSADVATHMLYSLDPPLPKSCHHQYADWGDRSHEIAPSCFHTLFLALSVISESCVSETSTLQRTEVAL